MLEILYFVGVLDLVHQLWGRGYKRVVLSMSMGPDETSEGFYLGELVVVLCPWGGGGEEGTHKKTISQILCSH